MKTSYLPPHIGWETPPEALPDLVSSSFDDDDVTDLIIEFATYFTVIAANPEGWRRGESNYTRSEHLTLASARAAAKTRYDNDPKKRGILIYAVLQYSNRPIGTSRVVESYPFVSNPYSREARAAKRKTYRRRKALRDIPDQATMAPSGRYFEPTEDDLAEIKRKLDEMKVVGKGGSKIAFKYRNRSKR
jgi:hypothetical protein